MVTTHWDIKTTKNVMFIIYKRVGMLWRNITSGIVTNCCTVDTIQEIIVAIMIWLDRGEYLYTVFY